MEQGGTIGVLIVVAIIAAGIFLIVSGTVNLSKYGIDTSNLKSELLSSYQSAKSGFQAFWESAQNPGTPDKINPILKNIESSGSNKKASGN